MDARGALVRRNELFNLSGIWIQPPDSVPGSKIGDPDFSVFIWRGAERHAIRSGHIVFHIRNFYGLIAEGPQRLLVSRQFSWRFRQLGIHAKRIIQIRDDRSGSLIVDVIAQARAPDVAHVVDGLRPTVRVPARRGHSRLEPVTGKTFRGYELFTFPIGQQLLPLVNGKVTPAHHPFLQSEIERRGSTGTQFHSYMRVAHVSDSVRANFILSWRQSLNLIPA